MLHIFTLKLHHLTLVGGPESSKHGTLRKHTLRFNAFNFRNHNWALNKEQVRRFFTVPWKHCHRVVSIFAAHLVCRFVFS